MKINDITNALNARLKAMASLPPVAWPNVQYQPVDGTLYLRANNLRAGSSVFTHDYNDDTIGIYQVDVFAPLGNGCNVAEDMAEKIAQHFADSRRFGDISIVDINAASPVRMDNWYVIPVSIGYRVLGGRNG